MRSSIGFVVFTLASLAAPACLLGGQQPASLSEEEEDKIREAQDPSERIELYLQFSQVRLDRFEGFRAQRADPRYDNGAYLDSLLDQYIKLNDELKDWIDYQFERQGDMRRGLRALLERGPRQLEMLRHIQETPDAYATDYKNTLNDALDNLKDTLDGATKALADQQKKFADLKREEKADARAVKERAKGEKKREKEEKKLRKKEHHKGAPGEADED